jgi:hypothetical protein
MAKNEPKKKTTIKPAGDLLTSALLGKRNYKDSFACWKKERSRLGDCC